MKRIVIRWVGIILLGVSLLLILNGIWIKTKPLLADFLLSRAWQRSVNGAVSVKAWPWADSRPVARLRVPRLGVDCIVLEGDCGEVLAFGPGHVTGSAGPLAAGNCVLVGHRDTTFEFLKKLKKGDVLTLGNRKNEQGHYRVQWMTIVSAEDLYLNEVDGSWLTLITCYPFDAVLPGTDHRYVVFAKRMVRNG